MRLDHLLSKEKFTTGRAKQVRKNEPSKPVPAARFEFQSYANVSFRYMWAASSVGQSTRLITERSEVQIFCGPPIGFTSHDVCRGFFRMKESARFSKIADFTYVKTSQFCYSKNEETVLAKTGVAKGVDTMKRVDSIVLHGHLGLRVQGRHRQ